MTDTITPDEWAKKVVVERELGMGHPEAPQGLTWRHAEAELKVSPPFITWVECEYTAWITKRRCMSVPKTDLNTVVLRVCPICLGQIQWESMHLK